MSGIVTLLFCGIAINKYALPNMSNQAKKVINLTCVIEQRIVNSKSLSYSQFKFRKLSVYVPWNWIF